MERRGSRARRRMLAVDIAAAEASGNNSSFGVKQNEREQDDPPVIDTTSVEVERKADGSVAKVNEYVVVRDLGRGSSAEVKLCRLLMPPDRVIDNRHTNDNGLSATRESIADTVGGGGGEESRSGSSGSGSEGQRRRRARGDTYKERVERQEGGQDHGRDQERDELDGGDLYAVKIFDRAELMRRGARFARPRARGPDGALLPAKATPENYIKVQREIAIMKKLVHPNVVQLVEVIDAPRDRSLYMVMEYVERGAVMCCVEQEMGRYECSPSVSEGGCLDARTAARYFADVLAGLEYLHLQLIAHRDLKPENVLIGNDDRAKIADFGVSQYFHDDEPRTLKSARSLARSTSRAQMSSTEGTWCFWSPEMCGERGEGAAFNAYASDAWAAGVTLWCLLYGTVPFFSLNPMDLFTSIAQDPAPVPDGADMTLKDLLNRLLTKDPGKRLTVPEARDHCWVQPPRPGERCGDRGEDGDGGGEGGEGGGSGGSGGRGGSGGEGGEEGEEGGVGSVAFLRGALLAKSSFSSSLSPSALLAADDSRFGAAAAAAAGGGDGDVGDGGGGGGDGGGSKTAGPWGDSARERVAVSDADVRAAVTEAPGFVLVAKKIKGKVDGMKVKARRLSSELGGATVASLAGVKGRNKTRKKSRSSSSDRGGDAAAAAAGDRGAPEEQHSFSSLSGRGQRRQENRRKTDDDEEEEVEEEEEEEREEEEQESVGPHLARPRASSAACVIS
ncbi:Ca2+/calmodulin-dependent protein kinase kinase beta and related serine/threonine protein kinases [Ectocarpus siliculosus]|uniref:Ca2+/calmodulin-dependent protein kinase kinase beta and related serine/threonine protein kinases n=1 Tax=Ectocarpus siliculosus TaxID=2880 RepID=D8LKE4_ECTSI|nr:Ca2+/calmodulin-dependent protein kinase kinase beta and related serine/threonine protein kinases [Ectocarpus siliculosus]|eukprot:CBN74534.1 Ca2+/calmodulin-dependent protein kinase kinase beta and related serine/threonine protein kinases [Ectocarpus siliculosus]